MVESVLVMLSPAFCDFGWCVAQSVAAEYIALGGRTVHSKRWSQILADTAIFAYPTCIRRRGFPSEYCNDVW